MSGQQSTHRNGGAAIVESLATHGVDTIFGIPGTHNLELYRALPDCGIHAVTPRHEQGAGYAAEAYARVSGRPGVVIATSGPGMTNTMTAAATAYAESQPMIVISPGVETGTVGQALGRLHETKDSSAAMGHLVRWSRRVESADEAAAAVTDAFASFDGTRPRPVHIEVPIDVLEQPWTSAVQQAAPSSTPLPEGELLDNAATLLTGAKRGVIIAGGGAINASAEIAALAKTLGIPVATTVNGKGVLDESHPLALGASVRLRALQEECAASDVVLVIGSELGDSDLWGGTIRSRNVIRLDIEAGQLDKNCPGDLHLLGDAAAVLSEIVSRIPAGNAVERGAPRAAVLRAACLDEARADAGQLEGINAAVRAGLPGGAILTGDSSQVTYFGSVHFFDVPGPRQFCYTPGYATLGYGLPAAIGAAIAAPDRPAAALMGDGALMFCLQELVTAVEQELSIPIVVTDNGGYREIRDQQALRNIAPIGVDLQTPDLAAIATAMGARGLRTTAPEDLTDLVAEATTVPGPTLIHLDIRS